MRWQCRHHNHTLDRRHGIRVCLLWRPWLLRKRMNSICIENGQVCNCSYDLRLLSCDIFEICAEGTLENMHALFTCSAYPRCRNGEHKSSVKENIQAIIYCKGKVDPKKDDPSRKAWCASPWCKSMCARFSLQRTQFPINTDFPMQLWQLDVSHIFAAPHPARRSGACESCYYS